MIGAVDLERLATRERAYLMGVALRKLNRRFLRDLEDVIQAALLIVWVNRAEIEDARSYASAVVSLLAMNWHRRDGNSDNADGTWLPAAIDPAGNIEQVLIAEAERAGTERNRRRILETLPYWDTEVNGRRETQERQFNAWRDRGFVCDTPAQKCAASRLRQAICIASGVSTVASKRVHVGYRQAAHG